MEPSNAEMVQNLPKCDRIRERRAGAEWENRERGKAAKTRPSNAEIEQNMLNCDR